VKPETPKIIPLRSLTAKSPYFNPLDYSVCGILQKVTENRVGRAGSCTIAAATRHCAVSDFSVADVDSCALFVGLFLHIVRSGIVI